MELARQRHLEGFLAVHGSAPILLVLARDASSELVTHLVSNVSAQRGAEEPMRALKYETELYTGDWQPKPGAEPFTASDLRLLLAAGTYVVAPLAKRAQDATYMERVSVGRARNKDIVLRDGSVSKFHAWFEVCPDGKVLVADAGSKNGTRVNGATLDAREASPLSLGDRLRFGVVEATLCSPELLWMVLQPG